MNPCYFTLSALYAFLSLSLCSLCYSLSLSLLSMLFSLSALLCYSHSLFTNLPLFLCLRSISLSFYFLNGQTLASFIVFSWSLQRNISTNIFTTNICEKMSIQYTVPGLKPTTWVSSTRPGLTHSLFLSLCFSLSFYIDSHSLTPFWHKQPTHMCFLANQGACHVGGNLNFEAAGLRLSAKVKALPLHWKFIFSYARSPHLP